MSEDLNLDVDAPDKVSDVLRNAAESFHESAMELTGAWQDEGAGKPWGIIARELEATAERIDKKLRKAGY